MKKGDSMIKCRNCKDFLVKKEKWEHKTQKKCKAPEPAIIQRC